MSGNVGSKRKLSETKAYADTTSAFYEGPAILLTGHGQKCRAEGAEIVDYYVDRCSKPKAKASTDSSEQKLDLEEELKSLKKSNGKKRFQKSRFFDEWNTKCRGVTFLKAKPVTNSSESDAKIARIDDGTKETLNQAIEEVAHERKQWDPVAVVQEIFDDVANNRSADKNGQGIPSSRFITRIIPIQVTCGVGLEPIKRAVRHLLSKSPHKSEAKTFAIEEKRRNCAMIKRNQIIDAVAGMVVDVCKPWKVNLSDPDFTVFVEICTTVAGVSVIGRDLLKNSIKFNYAAARDAQ